MVLKIVSDISQTNFLIENGETKSIDDTTRTKRPCVFNILTHSMLFLIIIKIILLLISKQYIFSKSLSI